MVDILAKTLKYQDIIEEKGRRFGRGKYGRVFRMSVKPEKKEFVKTLQITSIGLVIIGGLGFLIYLIWTHLPVYIKQLLGL